MAFGRVGGSPFWEHFCGRLDAVTLFSPSLLLWAGPPTPSSPASCYHHAAALALSSLLALCTLSHIFTLRKSWYAANQHRDTHHRATGTGDSGEDSAPPEMEEGRQSPPLVVAIRWPFWVNLGLSLTLGLLWGALGLRMAASALSPSGPQGRRKVASLDQVSFAVEQGVAWLVVWASFWACQYRGIIRLFSSARIFLLSTAVMFCVLAPISVQRLLAPDTLPSYGVLENVLLLLFCPAAVYYGTLGYSGSTGLDLEQPDPLQEQLLNGASSTAEAIPPLCDTVTPFQDAGVLSTALFSFTAEVLERGADAALKKDDVPQMRLVDRSLPISEHFSATLSRLQQAKPDSRPPIAMALFYTFYPILALTAALNLLQTSFLFVGPLLVPAIVSHVSSGTETSIAQGVWLVLALMASSSLSAIFSTQQQFRGQLLGLNIQSALVGALYKKGMCLSAQAKQKSSVGEIVNYMSTDTARLKDLCYQLNNIWVLPLQIVVALAVLFKVVGVAMLSGLAVMLGIMGINLVIANRLRAAMAETMKKRDRRMKGTTEALKSMRVIKLYAWQDQFEGQIIEMRDEEVHWLSRFMYTASINIFLLWLSPLAVAVATFSTMIFLGQRLDAGAVFAAIATFRILQEPLRSFPGVIAAVTQAMVSLKRLQEFLGKPELQTDAVTRLPFSGSTSAISTSQPPAAELQPLQVPAVPEDLAVSVENASFSWDDDRESLALQGINLKIKKGARVAICGAVGAGKSTLLSCILGEVPRLCGKVTVRGATAYVPQSAWIQNATVRDNILFGQPFDEAKYKETLRCCALETDITLFSHGDKTQIGERGVNLSGGQKQRVQLARALYQGGDVFLLDDPFSAVDAHTGSALFMDYILGALQGKTVIFVTHQVEFLPAADLVVVMKEGKITQLGTFDDLKASGADLAALVDAHEKALKSVDSSNHLNQGADSGESRAGGSAPQEGNRTAAAATDERKATTNGNKLEAEAAGGKGPSKRVAKSGQLVQEEEQQSGRVSPEVYWLYVTKALGGALVPVLILIQLFWQSFQIGSDYWLAEYSSGKGHITPAQFLDLYALLAAASGTFVGIRSFAISWAGLCTTQRFFQDMLRSVFHAPMSFFDSTPIGRILSRASTDQASLDLEIPFVFGSLLAMCFSLFGILFVCSFITWPVLFAIVPLAYLYVSFKEYYLASSRELTRMSGVTRAPIIEHFSESLAGAAVIRAFGQEGRFEAKSRDTVDTNNRISFCYAAATNWMSVHLQLIGSFLLSLTALMLIVLPPAVVSPGLAGMSLSYGLALSEALFYTVWMWCALENSMVSVERIQQYSSLPAEKALSLPGSSAGPAWPSAGHIVFDKVEVRYREDMPLVLKGVSLDVLPCSKVGVVGRTGSGKSTLVAALFRIVEPCAGDILIDGVSILHCVGLGDLRSRLSIIPQDPTLFEGTVRYNLDPLQQYSEADIWEALGRCQLAEAVQADAKKLDAAVSEGGENWSVGQRQLFCLGRALLKHSKVLVLDEATASVDSATDAVIQETIRHNFGGCTVISIAHRIPTVMDCDGVLVMDQGVAAEYASPAKLLENPNSLFSKLVAEYSARSSGMAEIARNSSAGNLRQ